MAGPHAGAVQCEHGCIRLPWAVASLVSFWWHKANVAYALFFQVTTTTLLHEMETPFPQVNLMPGDTLFNQRIAYIVSWIARPKGTFMLPLDLRGTAFQYEVWQALRTLAPGMTARYQALASSIGGKLSGYCCAMPSCCLQKWYAGRLSLGHQAQMCAAQ